MMNVVEKLDKLPSQTLVNLYIIAAKRGNDTMRGIIESIMFTRGFRAEIRNGKWVFVMKKIQGE